MKLDRNLREFIELLNSQKVDYIVVGGHAVAFHGHPRFTGDIDLLLRPAHENAERVIAVVKEFGFAEVSLAAEDFMRPKNKQASGRDKDVADVRKLVAINSRTKPPET